ncbi:MAG: M48 family peptidase [Runella slithyformis]|nr:MAG: M48 family peptidase [Runella slithyformis]TAF27184.1 MAG: M48 family peptidase [Runella slithyformis]TAF45832.1 MAG: M48 family peptidase [Runella slithyformis]TAF78878.1 MAG: M48 family peptidase [Runella slithyformis]TAH15228.1 MAG: M48 family peptidase [Runella slithyformis]
MERSRIGGRLLIALIMGAVALIGYYSKTQVNPVTGRKQQVSMTPQEEVALGLQSAPQMAAEYGGLHNDARARELVKRIGESIIGNTEAGESPYQFQFHLLADPETINAFAIPGGQVFITMGLLKRLKTEDQLAGVLGHEIGHVIGRHSAQQMAKQELVSGLAGAASAAMSDPNSPSGSAYITQYVANLMNLKYGRDDELEADDFGVKYLVKTGRNPDAMLEVIEILAQAGGKDRPAEFQSTHPSPENRVIKIKEAMAKYRTL